MAYEETITKILGEHTDREGEVANLVLSYVAENPDWGIKEERLYRSKVLRAVDTALLTTFKNPLSHYLGRSRKREVVEVRFMVFLLLRQETTYSFNQIGRVFGKNHSTVIFGVKTAQDLIDTSREFREDYNTFKNCYLNLL